MMVDFFRGFICFQGRSEADRAVDAEFEPCRNELELAGLSEEELRNMDPDDRVAALEQAQLDPYDYIYLACS